MNLHDIKINLEKLNTEYSLEQGASEKEINKAQELIGEKFPEQIIEFYKNCNGFSVNSKLEVYEINQLKESGNIIVFAVFNKIHPVGYDISRLNTAGQWDIVNVETKFIITHTMASFLTNKIWAWLLRGREIWAIEKYT